MTSLIPLVLKASILLTVFAIGLSTRPQDLAYVMRRPGLLIRSLLSINFVMPLFATVMVNVAHLQPVVQISLIALSVSPVPPLLPKKARNTAGQASYAIGLLVVAAVFAIVFVPLAVHFLGMAFGTQSEIPPMTIASIVATNVLAPMGAGLVFHHLARRLAERIAKPVSALGSVLLVVSVLAILFAKTPEILSLTGNGTLAAVATFVLVGLAAGHLLGGPEPANRAVLALTTSSRHPGVAAAIATANFPLQTLAGSTILLYLLVNVIASVAYTIWFRHRYPEAASLDGASKRHGIGG
jgi:bile acid:Na+ symporter, BASS family